MSIRRATHAGSWYEDSKSVLSAQLDEWLDAVPSSTTPIGERSAEEGPVELPSKNARAIIAPHAGYSYSGPAAAWAYKALDLSNAKRIFLLGPSHKVYLTNCALSGCSAYETPLGNLKLDRATIEELNKSGMFSIMSRSTDENEHSLEMHLPYIYKILSRQFKNEAAFPPLVPIMVGSTSARTEAEFGRLLAPYIADPTSIFILSSDFAHWGLRFDYTYYQPPHGQAMKLSRRDKAPKDRKIYESIAVVDEECMDACETGRHEDWLDVLERTRNTVCGRHPIGVFMAGNECLGEDEQLSPFKFVRYERSSDCETITDSSVSYCSGFAVGH